MVTYGWWGLGNAMKKYNLPITHKSAKLTMTDNRVFGRMTNSNDIWDLRDSVLELCENEQRLECTLNSNYHSKIEPLPSSLDDATIRSWLEKDSGNGFIRIYPPNLNNYSKSYLYACNLKTPAIQICQQLGIGINVLHLQLNGDVVRRLEPQELPLNIQNEFLISLGYSDIVRIQEEGANEDLAYLIKFYSGKPIYTGGQQTTQLQALLQVKRGGVLQQWMTKWCVIYNTRIHFYKDERKTDTPMVFQLMGGNVEMSQTKSSGNCLKIATLDSDKQILLSFQDYEDCSQWFNRCKKATERLPTAADLSCCHLEYLPDNIFINEKLAVLNLQHNLLRQRISIEDTKLGWIDDLGRFEYLRSLNLADNNLNQFPPSLCKIQTLIELNLASNKIKEVPSEIKQLENLQVLHLHNNHLSHLPDEMILLKKLSILILAFNRFAFIPSVVARITNIRSSDIDSVVMAGNQIERITTDVLMDLKYARKLDLRLNQLSLPLTETMKFSVLEHLSHLDVRDNQISELDLKSLKTLEFLCCERNGMTTLSLNGGSLKVLLASCNCLDQLIVFPKPEGLIHFDVSDNCLEYLPDWLSECFQLKKLIAYENFIRELPSKLFANTKKLMTVNLAHNHLTSLPSDIGDLILEELQIQHNFIFTLPPNLLKKLTRLVLFNASRSILQSLPSLNDIPDLNRLQELYLSGNFLGNSVMKIVSGYTRLKVLNLAHNELSELYDEDILKLEMLQELNVSSNQLQSLPECLGNLPNLVVLRAHSNFLISLPNFCNAKALRILDVGHNRLLNISVTDLMASKLNLLDIGLNEQLKVDRQEFKNIIGKKNICLVDSSGQNKKLPGLSRKKFSNGLEPDDPSVHPWKVGFSESSGSRNKLCIQIVKHLEMNERKDCLVGIFDGGKNNELPKLLAKCIREIIEDELSKEVTSEKFMKYAFLTAHRNLRLTGQKLGVSAALCHIRKSLVSHSPTTSSTGSSSNGVRSPGLSFNFVLTIANVGDVEAVLCRKGEAVLLTRKFVAPSDQEETQRVCKSGGIVTEDGKVMGVTPCTRQLGCAHLYPYVIPDPFYASLPLQNDDEFIIIASSSFWKYVPYEEAVEAAYDIGNPVVASKHLQDLAECYGSKENIAVLVIRLNTEPGPSLGRLKPPHREMSVDDVEAAIQHDIEIAQRRSNHKKIIGGQLYQPISYIKNRAFFPQSLLPQPQASPLFEKNMMSNGSNNAVKPVTFSQNTDTKEGHVSVPFQTPENRNRLEDDRKRASNSSSNSTENGSRSINNSSSSTTSASSQVKTRPLPLPPSSSINLMASHGIRPARVDKQKATDSPASADTFHKSSEEGSISFSHSGNSSTRRETAASNGGSSAADVSPMSSVSSGTDTDSDLTLSYLHPPPKSPKPNLKKPKPVPTKPAYTIPKPPFVSFKYTSHKPVPPAPEFQQKGFAASGACDENDRRASNLNDEEIVNHDHMMSRPKTPATVGNHQSRFIKRSSAIDALIVPKKSSYTDFCSSYNSLLDLDDEPISSDSSNHSNKIAAAKEKKLSLYLATNKTTALSPGDAHSTRTSKPLVPPNRLSCAVTPGPVRSVDDVKDSEIMEIMKVRPGHTTSAKKRGSIMNTIAMFESANAKICQDVTIPDKNFKTIQTVHNVPDRSIRDKKESEAEPKATLNLLNYQLAHSRDDSKESPKCTQSTLVRSSYTSNVKPLPKTFPGFHQSNTSNHASSNNTTKVLEIVRL